MKARIAEAYKHSFVRFLAVGGANLGLSYGVYLVFWYSFNDYRIAFWMSVLAGLVFMSIANIRHTFLKRLSIVSVLFYAGYYYAFSLVNLLALTYLIEVFNVWEEVAPFITLVVLTPVHYVLSKRLIHLLSAK